MRRRSFVRLSLLAPPVVVAASALAGLSSCGSRTGLYEPYRAAGAEGGVDVAIPIEAAPDVLPPFDVVEPDVPVVNLCPDAAATLIYVIGTSNMLYSFDPATSSFTAIGMIDCPSGPHTSPFSMAVDRQGFAYVVFIDDDSNDGAGLFRLNTKNAECTPTAYDPAAYRHPTFGMGFVADADGGETLYVSEDNDGGDGTLAIIDTTTFVLTQVGSYQPISVVEAELTGTGGGQLFAFQPNIPSTCPGPSNSGAFIFEIDPKTADVLGADPIPGDLPAGNGWAFGFWGGDFYTFTTPSCAVGDDTTVVHRFDPVTKTLSGVLATNPDTIVGAGVSTCAPQ